MESPQVTDDLILYLVAQDLLGRYAHAVDHGDLDVALGVFWPDATDHHGDMWNGNAQEYMHDMYSRIHAARTDSPPAVGPGFQHHVTTIVVHRIGADDAKVQASFLAYVPHGTGAEAGVGLVVGRFLDHIQRRDGTWKIFSRVVVNDFTDGNVCGTSLPSGSWQHGGYVSGGWGSSDPSIAFLSGGT
ncbi:nuclear transport factor 2 family protein [Rhodococcoides yunnanense]|uniref:nuclear transport factor 2 family protein n=1 Tax=Rhodococcoides yunnanense TaxID=278209 RepID=UPI0009333BF8|nr:nuclear transport factor 2 family protein [Rhodococcus yunnanensis]